MKQLFQSSSQNSVLEFVSVIVRGWSFCWYGRVSKSFAEGVAEKFVNSFEGDRQISLKRDLTLYTPLKGLKYFRFSQEGGQKLQSIFKREVEQSFLVDPKSTLPTKELKMTKPLGADHFEIVSKSGWILIGFDETVVLSPSSPKVVYPRIGY